LSKILAASRLSGAVWIEAFAVRLRCPRTCCADCDAPFSASSSLLRDISKIIRLSFLCQVQSFLHLRPLHSGLAVTPKSDQIVPTGASPSGNITQRKISKIVQRTKRLSQCWLTGVNPWVLQWQILCGFPYRGSGANRLTRPNELAPYVPQRAGHSATGRFHCSTAYHSTASLQLFKSIKLTLVLQALICFPRLTPLRLSKSITSSLSLQVVCFVPLTTALCDFQRVAEPLLFCKRLTGWAVFTSLQLSENSNP
jgi:hypothetical protein